MKLFMYMSSIDKFQSFSHVSGNEYKKKLF